MNRCCVCVVLLEEGLEIFQLLQPDEDDQCIAVFRDCLEQGLILL